MTPETTTGRAAARFPHGSLVRFESDDCHLEQDLKRAEGVTKRPHQARTAHHEPGEHLLVQTSGGIMAEVAGHSRWLELRKGRVIDG